MDSSARIFFSKFLVTKQKSKHTYALVNLKPLVPGHVLVVPLRLVPHLKDLTTEESIDYMLTIQFVHKFIQHHYKADSLNLSIQDGPEAGQSVPHLHTHIIPRYKADGYGDAMYLMLEKKDLAREFGEAAKDWAIRREIFKQEGTFSKVLDDNQRTGRLQEVMLEEALMLKAELEKYGVDQ
ncbi:hypothetical protein BABINDRAFT_159710 [Babjeviella inositovora NRRL Y-12698]|uniref:Bis(5'-adenosyl)-triphosphatase n=1 Tax=Babjeviella inositovora NRRL Y-12698 TaxID=984486 RepID=A0A1E3QWF3_9ASCO|nr:uncharacterized protein BABINDRAFT_159710 [Babjeviella inositovora NRRL Y-12698]ODQ81412.1 hypothetical protein BABINDRAFT_159710 [Babjeviella inositovora NRRL Y-12698]